MSGVLRWKYMFLFTVVLLFATSTYAKNATTTVQLRKSVQFSYDGANLFLDLIRGSASRNDTAELLQASLDSHAKGYHSLLILPIFRHFPGYMACVIFGVLFAVFMPLIGIFFCCLRCCGRCGGRVTQMDRKGDPCRRVCYTITLAIITTVQLCAIVLAFINYQLHYEAVFNRDISVGMLPQLTQSAELFQLSVNEIISAAKNSSSANLDVQKRKFDDVFDTGLRDFQNDFVKSSSASAVLKSKQGLQGVIYNFSSNSPRTTELLDFFRSLEQLNSELPFMRQTISDIIDQECPVEKLTSCRDLRSRTDRELVVSYTLDEFQENQVKMLLTEFAKAQDYAGQLDIFNQTLMNMKEDVEKNLQPLLDEAWKDLSNSPKTREDLVKTIETVANSAMRAINDTKKGFLQVHSSDSPLVRYQDYLLYTGIAVLCLPVLVILLHYLGLCFGACGDRPYEEASLCNRGVGANLLMSGVVFTFLFSTLLMIICMVVFLAGGLFQTEVCRYATSRYPNGPAVLDDVLEVVVSEAERTRVGGGDASTPSNSSTIAKARPFGVFLTHCATKSLVDSVGDEIVGMMVSDSSINTFLENLLSTFNGIDLISPLRTAARETQVPLERLDAIRNYDFSGAIAACSKPLTGVSNLEVYLSQLRDLGIPSLYQHIDLLKRDVEMLDLRRDVIRNIYEELDSLRGYYTELVDSLRQFSQELDQTVPSSIRQQIDNMRPLFLKELRLAVIASWRHIPCTRLHEAATLGVDSVCLTFLGPLNGFWFGLGLCLVLFIPSVIFAVKLVNLYRKTEKYSPDYEEPDYISYHGFYMRPASGDGEGSAPRKRRPKKGKSGPPRGKGGGGGGGDNGAYGFSHRHGPANSNYQQVSVYPYDAYD